MVPFTSNYGFDALTASWFPVWAAIEPMGGTLLAVTAIIFIGCVLNGYLLFALLLDEDVAPGLALLGGAALQIFPISRYFYYNTHLNLMDWFWLPVCLLLWKRIAAAVNSDRPLRLAALALVQGIVWWASRADRPAVPDFCRVRPGAVWSADVVSIAAAQAACRGGRAGGGADRASAVDRRAAAVYPEVRCRVHPRSGRGSPGDRLPRWFSVHVGCVVGLGDTVAWRVCQPRFCGVGWLCPAQASPLARRAAAKVPSPRVRGDLGVRSTAGSGCWSRCRPWRSPLVPRSTSQVTIWRCRRSGGCMPSPTAISGCPGAWLPCS